MNTKQKAVTEAGNLRRMQRRAAQRIYTGPGRTVYAYRGYLLVKTATTARTKAPWVIETFSALKPINPNQRSLVNAKRIIDILKKGERV